MLRKTTIVLFLAIASLYTNAQDKWFSQKINDKVTVNFPIEPKKLNEVNYGVRDNNNVVFLVTTVDLLKVTGLSLEEFNKNIVEQKWADEFMAGLIPTMPKYTFKSAKITTVKGNTAYWVSGRDEEGKTTIFMNLVFVDGNVHNIASIVPDGIDTKNKDRFLTEIYINGK